MIYNGKDFSDFGVHVDESKSFGTPEKDYELIEIMGRNGSYSIYNNRFKDIELSFPCFIRTGFIEKYRNLLAYLSSQNGYQRLETEKEPEHFRKALFLGMVEPQTTAFNHGGFFTVNFHALPQRFLKSGENVSSISTQSTTLSGNPIEIDNPSGLTTITDLQTSFSPKQDLNGYDHPWVGGAGKNLFPGVAPSTVTSKGITYEFVDDNSGGNTWHIIASGTSTDANADSGNKTLGGADAVPVTLKANKTYVASLTGVASTSDVRLFLRSSTATLWYGNSSTGVWVITPTEDIEVSRIMIRVLKTGSIVSIDGYFQIEEGTAQTEWEPYSNICPIEYWRGKNFLQTTPTTETINGVTFTVNEDGTVSLSGTSTARANFSLPISFPLPDDEYILSGCPKGGSTSTYYQQAFASNTGRGVDVGDGTEIVSPASDITRITITIRNAGITTDGLVFKPMIRLATETDPTYMPCGANMYVKRTGKNLFDPATLLNGYYGSATAETLGGDKTLYRTVELYLTKGTYTISFDVSVNIVRYREKGIISVTNPATNVTNHTFTVSADSMVALGFRRNDSTAWEPSTAIQLEKGSVATEYEPYTETMYYVAFPSEAGTVYGGTVDLTTGVLTVTHKQVTLNGSESWAYVKLNGLDTFNRTAADGVVPARGTGGYEGWCDSFPVGTGVGSITGIKDNYLYISLYALTGTRASLLFVKNGITSADDFKTWLSNNNVNVVYPMQTPQTVQLTAQQISLLTGVNYISIDADTLTVTITEPSILENPTLFESKPLIKLYGSGTLNINDQYITVTEHPFPYIDIDCELMDAFYQSSNANQYVSFSTDDYVTLQSGSNYFAYSGFTKVEVTPRWWEV